MDVSRIVLIVCVVAFTATAAVCDARFKKLPNLLTVPAFASAVLFHVVSGAVAGGAAESLRQFLFAMGGFATGFGILLVMWMIGSGGGGDVKFMGALGAWLGTWATVQVFVLGAALVVVGTVGVLAWEFVRLGFRRTQERYVESGGVVHGKKLTEDQRRTRRRLMPFGIPAAVATWLVLAFTRLPTV
jgi:prepilin peptidase CpaA